MYILYVYILIFIYSFIYWTTETDLDLQSNTNILVHNAAINNGPLSTTALWFMTTSKLLDWVSIPVKVLVAQPSPSELKD